jgi:hypothetical protein
MELWPESGLAMSRISALRRHERILVVTCFLRSPCHVERYGIVCRNRGAIRHHDTDCRFRSFDIARLQIAGIGSAPVLPARMARLVAVRPLAAETGMPAMRPIGKDAHTRRQASVADIRWQPVTDMQEIDGTGLRSDR